MASRRVHLRREGLLGHVGDVQWGHARLGLRSRVLRRREVPSGHKDQVRILCIVKEFLRFLLTLFHFQEEGRRRIFLLAELPGIPLGRVRKGRLRREVLPEDRGLRDWRVPLGLQGQGTDDNVPGRLRLGRLLRGQSAFVKTCASLTAWVEIYCHRKGTS